MRSIPEIETSINQGMPVPYAERCAYQVYRWLEKQSWFPPAAPRDANDAARDAIFASLCDEAIPSPQWFVLPSYPRTIARAIGARLAEERRRGEFAVNVWTQVANEANIPENARAAAKLNISFWQERLSLIETHESLLGIDLFNLTQFPSTNQIGLDE